jgi:hypothetical protein
VVTVLLLLLLLQGLVVLMTLQVLLLHGLCIWGWCWVLSGADLLGGAQ